MKKLLLLLIVFTANLTYSQVGIGTDMPNSSAQLEIVSSNRGVLIPQVPLTSVTDETTISAGNIESLLVYNTNTATDITPGYYYWYQGSWNKLLAKKDLQGNIVFWDVVNNQFTYIDENGDVQIINNDNLETITTLVDNGDGTITYFNENNDEVTIDLTQGSSGEDGANGIDGVGISSTTDNGDGTFTIVYTDGSTFTTSDFTGPQGAQGVAGAQGPEGAVGATGVGISSTVNNGDGTFTITYTDGSTFVTSDFNGTAGVDGINGTNGTDGVGIASTVNNGDGTFTITYTDGSTFVTSDFNGTAGVDGTNGESAYQEWLDAGNTGSEQDFLDSLVGAQGIAGTDGVDGTNGTNGETPTIGTNGNWFIGTTDTGIVAEGQNGTDGESAYAIAVDEGYTGTETEWLASLNGTDGSNGETPTIGSNGNWFIGTTDTGVVAEGSNGTNGESAYQEWLDAGNTGSEQDFLDSLVGAQGMAGTDGVNGTNGTDGSNGVTPTIGTNGNWFIGTTDTGIVAEGQNGTDGESAYEIAVDGGFTGTETEWLASLNGTDGSNGETPTIGTNGNWFIGTTDTGIVAEGQNGTDGESAYAIAIDGGFTGTETEWLASLNGTDGSNGETPTIGTNGNWFIGSTDTGVVAEGSNGTNGESAYQEWLDAGNTGSEQDFLDSLVGAQGIAGTDGVDGTNGTNGETPTIGTNGNWFIGTTDTGVVAEGQDGTDGDSAYEIAVDGGFTGTETEWLASLNGADGTNGESAYQEWLDAGNTGSEQDFLDSLVGAQGIAGTDGVDGTNGTDGSNGVTPTIGTNGNWFIGTTDTGVVAEGLDGTDGDSAYEIAVDGGFTGTETEWIASLNGSNGTDGTNGETPTIGTNGNWFIGTTDTGVVAEGQNGTDGVDGAQGIQGIQGVQGAVGPQGEPGVAGTNGSDGATGVVDPKDLTAGDASITVTNGIDATLVDSNVKVTDGGITTIKLADNAVTTLKINAGAVTAPKLDAGTSTDETRVGVADVNGDVTYQDLDVLIDEPWRNTDDSAATNSSTDINFMGGNVGLGILSPSNLLHVKPETATEDPVRFEGLQSSTDSADKIVLATADGVLKTVDGTVSQLKSFLSYKVSSFNILSVSVTIGGNNYKAIGFPASGEEFDENDEYNTATGEFTAKQAGIYNINIQANNNGLVSAAQFGVGIFKTPAGSSSSELMASDTYLSVNVNLAITSLDVSPPTRSAQALVKLEAGDMIQFGVVTPLAADVLAGYSAQFSIYQVK
ncbi:hypothetical protein [Formosa sp. PL04]|uniref:beta strand repeat-containing protein n=1 Tax=Formosa sp. PL04 TaxID=3081755 RepID=UPI0029821DC0|nr:hypothetical protein [Formosa sp. PL04]MDW5289143.1 hypothetical protein [Formosa sp. PL04]